MTGTLYVVATPIGNLEDITLRALRVLGEVDLIAAEDTRRTRKLLTHYDVRTPVTSYFEHNELVKGPSIVAKLKSGSDVALVTDAGTPGLADPGFRLLELALDSGIEVTTIPGASALTAVLSIAGLPFDEFTFKGFVPTQKGRRKNFFLQMRGMDTTYVLYESPRRVAATLEVIRDVLGDVRVVVAREMTKLHEEFLRGSVGEVIEMLEGRALKGEVTIVVRAPGETPGKVEMEEAITALIKDGHSLKDVARAASREYGVTRGEAYRTAMRIKKGL